MGKCSEWYFRIAARSDNLNDNLGFQPVIGVDVRSQLLSAGWVHSGFSVDGLVDDTNNILMMAAIELPSGSEFRRCCQSCCWR